jgi:NTP pyrophosphatase (non-canonical NTP hydrolase)
MTLQALQQRVEAILGAVRHPRVGAALALSEETGEVCDLVLKRECYGTEVDPAKLGGELVDVLVCVAELANAYGVDLEQAARDKLADLARRAPVWAEELGPHLAAARARMDAQDAAGA